MQTRPLCVSGKSLLRQEVEGQILYAGASPDMVAGITQLNVRIPGNARVSSRVPITITAGDTTVLDVGYLSIK